MGFLKILPQVQFIKSSEEDELLRKVEFFKKQCEKSRLDYQPEEIFFYSLDPLTRTLPKTCSYTSITNLTVDYNRILQNGIIGLKTDVNNRIKSDTLKESQKIYLNQLLDVLESIKLLRDRQLEHLHKLAQNDPEKWNLKDLADILSQVPLYPAITFKQALQSILFTNSLIWMDGHALVGLGRLDQILYPFLKKDLKHGLEPEEAEKLISEFLKSLHKYYEYKSNTLLGDTGQVIVLGGLNQEGEDTSNQLTLMFLDALKKLKLPDPKIVLRVHPKTPPEVWNKAFQCLEEGMGYPLFSNDDIIINSLIKFGYREEDAFDYTTSACWEPLIPGKSLDQNNMANMNFLEPLKRTLDNIKERKTELNDFGSFLKLYQKFLEEYVEENVKSTQNVTFEPSPLLSILVDGCVENGQDISEGGARYNHYGLLTVGLGNTINALLNIKRLSFDEAKLSIVDINSVLDDNFRSNETLRVELLNKGYKYGMDEEEVINLTNTLIDIVKNKLNDYTNVFKGKYKFGLSSPSYIMESVDFPASFDGRMAGQPFGVHISPSNYTPNIGYTEISNFASALSYEKAFNGDVVDIMVEKSFLKNIKKNFLDYLKISFFKGVMQMQINVLNTKKLIKARNNPELYPNLIVRVWGFSAYFKDLPDEYKDLIINRALQYESQNHQYPAV